MYKKDFLKTKSKGSVDSIKTFFKEHRIGTLVILILTVFYFWALIGNLGNYSEGGDAMFNAWNIAWDQHCILREGCPSLVNANIYFPHKDTLLYSESQLSAGFLTLPLLLINQNPIFSYNVLTIASFFFSGWFMYLLVKRLSKGSRWSTLFSIMAGLVFEYAPIKMSDTSHLQNLSIFYLPLIFLMALNYFESKKWKWLIPFFIALVLQFYASWEQMVFVLVAVLLFLLGMLVFKVVKPKLVVLASAILFLATISTLPLAVEYVQFSKSTPQANFGILDQVTYSSSLSDYILPNNGTIIGKIYYNLRHYHAQINSYNPDSYSYDGVILYAVGAGVTVFAYKKRKQSKEWLINYKILVTLLAIALAGFVISLGPLLKLKAGFSYPFDSLLLVIPLPYILVDKLIPQISFIRAVGRADILVLFALCVALAYLPLALKKSKISKKLKMTIALVVCLLIFVEVLPIHRNGMDGPGYSYSFTIPKAYKFIKSDKSVNDILVLRADKDYPGATIPIVRAEDILWAGYDNKNIFNGYSGYTPPQYYSQYAGFQNFDQSELVYAKSLGIRYVLVDKQLSTSNPKLNSDVAKLAVKLIYEDARYSLYKI